MPGYSGPQEVIFNEAFFILYYWAIYVNRLYNLYEHIITQQIEYQIILARAHPKLYEA